MSSIYYYDSNLPISQKMILAKMRINLSLCILILFFIFLIPFPVFSLVIVQQPSLSVPEKLKLIPEEDRKSLNDFFSYLMTESCFAYTLFGDKPASFQEFSEDLNKISFDALQQPYSDYFLSHGWQTWEKYCHLFSHPHFIFKKMKSLSNYHFIVIINKKTALIIIQRHLDYFRKVLGDEKTAIELLHQFDGEDPSLVFENPLKNDQVLMAILLGFGKENGLIFHQSDQICNQLIKTGLSPMLSQKHESQLTKSSRGLVKCFKIKGSTWSQEKNAIHYSTLCKKLNQIQEEIGSFSHPANHWIAKVGELQFKCLKKGTETQLLKVQYQKNLKVILQSSLMENLLETILNQLCHE